MAGKLGAAGLKVTKAPANLGHLATRMRRRNGLVIRPADAISREAIVDDNVLPLHEPRFAEAPPKGLDMALATLF
jgi:hypothetical protein